MSSREGTKKSCISWGFFLAKGDGNTFTRLCHAPQYLIFRKSLTSWKETQGSSMKSWKRKDQRKKLTLSRSAFFSARAIRMSRLSPLSWWGGFFECRWHNCWMSQYVFLCIIIILKKVEKTRQNMLASPDTVNAVLLEFVSTCWVILRLCCSPLRRYLKPRRWQCWEK